MSKKHFEKFAIAIGGIMDTTERKRVANLIGEVCAEVNIQFNWDVWYKACNVKA